VSSGNAYLEQTQAVAVSVIIVNWNRGVLLRSALDSLAGQTFDRLFEIVVVDND
jgi:glycosyltransferase involved in cell wall biosynthesis